AAAPPGADRGEPRGPTSHPGDRGPPRPRPRRPGTESPPSRRRACLRRAGPSPKDSPIYLARATPSVTRDDLNSGPTSALVPPLRPPLGLGGVVRVLRADDAALDDGDRRGDDHVERKGGGVVVEEHGEDDRHPPRGLHLLRLLLVHRLGHQALLPDREP